MAKAESPEHAPLTADDILELRRLDLLLPPAPWAPHPDNYWEIYADVDPETRQGRILVGRIETRATRSHTPSVCRLRNMLPRIIAALEGKASRERRKLPDD